jgi:activating signal cointegrator 1
MRALSLIQPYGSLVVSGEKRIETRSWKTEYRGWVIIHASKNYPEEYQLIAQEEPFSSTLARLSPLQFGMVIGAAYLIRCVKIHAHEETYGTERWNFVVPPTRPELDFGNYTPGRFAWLFTDHISFANPFPFRGMQGLWEIDDRHLTTRLSPDEIIYLQEGARHDGLHR